MSEWQELDQELAAWAKAGQRATLWWRDDDAVAPTPALERLLTLAQESNCPLALAVIPARATPGLATCLRHTKARVTVLQHGYAHLNHAPAGAKKEELGRARAANRVLEELARGAARMTMLFGDAGGDPPRAAVLVPPWNRIDPGLLPALPGLGFSGLSTSGLRLSGRSLTGISVANTHIDVMRWQEPRGFLGEAESLRLLIDHLNARRSGAAERGEPSGLLTHHLVHDQAAWEFLERLLPRLGDHPGVDFLTAAEAFAPGEAMGSAAASGSAS